MTISAEQRQLAANAIRALAIDATNRANSGHPGAPMGLADIAVVLWGEVMNFDPTDPDWVNRDRFVLSNGHASMLLYAALHMSGYDVAKEELMNFRQLGSKTPGHPEYGMTPGVETTTGPLGQGFANGVGMAIAAKMAKARFPGRIDHHVYGICGDGCLMEGVSAEAASMAGHLGLGEIVYLYDDNSITIDGSTDIAFSEDVGRRFEAYGWQVLKADGHNQGEVLAAVNEAKADTARPSIIMCRTHIGFGSPAVQDTPNAHGSPLGDEEAKRTKEKLGWTHAPFEIPKEASDVFSAAGRRGREAREKWKRSQGEWLTADKANKAAWDAHFSNTVSEDIYKDALAVMKAGDTSATRALSGKALNALAARIPTLVGGSADLAGSNKSKISGSEFISRESFAGRNLHFGVREHGMGAVVNGMALYGGFVPYGATFLTFSDYMRPSLRLAALMKIRALTVFTHESIYLGEDGPTHQSVEHTWALRMIPGLYVWRPADGVECAMAWSFAVACGDPAPHALLFTRQGVASLDRPKTFDPKDIWRGGYVVHDVEAPKVAIIATGSEVELAVAAAKKLSIPARVVSMPCVDLFLEQDDDYRAEILPAGVPRVSIELGRTGPWAELTGSEGLRLGIDQFGESAPMEVLREHFEMTPEHVSKKIKDWFSDL